MEVKIKMMQRRLEERLEQGRSRESELVAAREERLRLEEENTRLRHRYWDWVRGFVSKHHAHFHNSSIKT